MTIPVPDAFALPGRYTVSVGRDTFDTAPGYGWSFCSRSGVFFELGMVYLYNA
jgi:hypothetical protein